jgi:hypothetical protein
MRIAIAACLGLLVLALPACGGDDETTTTVTSEPGATGATGTTGEEGGSGGTPGAGGGASSGDESQVAQAVEQVVGGGDPEASCTTQVTENYVRAAYGDEQGCRAAVEGQGTFAVEVEDVTVEGESADATAIPGGGPNKGENLTVRLVDDDGEWKVDYLRSDAPAGP